MRGREIILSISIGDDIDEIVGVEKRMGEIEEIIDERKEWGEINDDDIEIEKKW